MQTVAEPNLPGAKLPAGKMPGHWLLARLGKRVLRPGGLELTQCMLEALAIHSSDAVVEFAPGLGMTTRLALDRHPASYIGIEADDTAAAQVRPLLSGSDQQCLVGSAAETSLPQNSAAVVYGEAMLTMQGPAQKCQIVQEAARLLKPGGRYGIHELCLIPDDLDDSIKHEIQQALSRSIHVGARPLTAQEWRAVLEAEGFEITAETLRPMRLLETDRLIQDEGLSGALRFAWNLCRDQEARQRVLAMRRVFIKYQSHLAAVMLVGVKRLNSARSKDSTLQRAKGLNRTFSWGETTGLLNVSQRRVQFWNGELFAKGLAADEFKSYGEASRLRSNEHLARTHHFLEMLDILNEELLGRREEPIVFDSDCREGICGTCSLNVNGEPHGPDHPGAVCEL